MGTFLDESITYVKGVGPQKANALETELNVSTLGDLLFKFPFRYVDKTIITPISSISGEDYVQVVGTLISKELVRGKNNQSRLSVTIKDDSGFLKLVWFRSVKFLDDTLEKHKEYLVYGKPHNFKGSISISHPEIDIYDATKNKARSLEPVYSSTEKLKKVGFEGRLRKKVIKGILHQLSDKDIVENLPLYIIEKLKLIPKIDAIRYIHFPPNQNALQAARSRIKFEEVFYFQLRMLYSKHQRKLKFKGEVFTDIGAYFNRYYKEKIPFELTNAQKEVIKEIRADLGSGAQMNRLLQGDVGSGKTMVALLSMLMALDNGYQSVLMAPTEILAQQHYLSISESVQGLGIKIAFLSGSVKGRTRANLLKFLKEGDLDILIGTHAVLEDPVIFKNLGLSIIDEQHRFGVMQRSKLWRKGNLHPPHILVMTATPIPRTLAMTVYGDLDVSVIDELPPGRKEIITLHKTEKNRSQIIEFMHKQIELGRQIYIVYPLIDESEKLDLANLQQGYDKLLQFFPLPKFKISVVHGRMKPADKDLEMKRFADGKSHIMVATTVIEVGVNVPNASVMIIENTERFGLSQLHQLRGRVGRGGEQSYCILMSGFKLSEYGKARIKIMTDTNDGFKIAEEDLKLRGPGDIEGTRQSGDLEFRLFDAMEDQTYLDTGRKLAMAILKKDPLLENELNAILKQYLLHLNQGFKDWGRIG